MLRNTKVLSIMHTNMGKVLKSPYKLIRVVKPSLHYLKESLVSSSYFITGYSGLLYWICHSLAF